MKANKKISNASQIDVRFSRFFGFLIIMISHAPLVYAAQQMIALRGEFFQELNFIVPSIVMAVGLIIIAMGMSHTRKWYLRIDRDKKILMISYGFGSWSKKHPYDSIHYDGKKFTIEQSGVKKMVGFFNYACNRKDLKSLIPALKEAAK
jgi:hypothetical protein